MTKSLLPLVAIVLTAFISFSCTPPTQKSTPAKASYIVQGVFTDGANDSAIVLVLKSGTYEPVTDATVTIDGATASFVLLGYGFVGGKTLTPGQTVSVRVVKDDFDVSGSVTLPGDFSIGSMTDGHNIATTTIPWAGLTSAPSSIGASVSSLYMADNETWTVSKASPAAAGNLEVPVLQVVASSPPFPVTISASNMASLSSAAPGSVLVGSVAKSCTITKP
jgi:hypothetical protein